MHLNNTKGLFYDKVVNSFSVGSGMIVKWQISTQAIFQIKL